jgi:ABC-2 type transport system permease protein
MRRRGLYLAVARVSLADRIAWRGDVFFSVAMGAARVALALVLWSAVFAGRAEVGGMSLALVTGYYVIAVFVFQFDQSGAASRELAEEIRTGRFGKYLTKPVDPLSWFLASSAGRSAFQAAVALGAAALVALALGLAGGAAGGAVPGGAVSLIAPISPLGILAALPPLASGLLSLALVNFMTGILAFRFQDVGAFQIAKDCLIEFISGAMIPLAMMPSWARGALGLTPFPALASLPADLALGRAPDSYAKALAILLAWNALLYLGARALYASLSERYEELGS